METWRFNNLLKLFSSATCITKIDTGACEKACYQDSDINHNCLIVKVFVVDSKDTIGS